jgi:phosphoglycolate phosphatase
MIDPSRWSGPIEIAPHFRPRPQLRHVLMDWDGTISLFRAGWVEMMVEVCLASLPTLSRPDVHAEMLALNGKPSIHQMTRIAELVAAAGGTPLHVDEYQRRYVEQITHVVAERMAGIHGGADPASLMVPGARGLLEQLAARGLVLTVASGTPHPELIAEAALLRVAHFFADRLHGPRDTADREFSKRTTIHQLVTEHGISGEELLAIGDGPIEISEVNALGGLTIGVAGDDTTFGSGRIDEFKRRQLLDCGADLIVPDYQHAANLIAIVHGDAAFGQAK